MSYDAANIFARILRGELPCHKVYEDGHTLAFMDIMPQTDGHTLVIPKEAADSIFDLSAEGAANLMLTTQKVARAVKAAMQAPGVMLVQLNGADAGQSVFHAHFHIMPRWGGLDLKFHARNPGDAKALAATAAKIASFLPKPN